MRISDWSSDVCSSDLDRCQIVDVWLQLALPAADIDEAGAEPWAVVATADADPLVLQIFGADHEMTRSAREARPERAVETIAEAVAARRNARLGAQLRSEEHTSELQSLMRTSYAVFCLKKKTPQKTTHR